MCIRDRLKAVFAARRIWVRAHDGFVSAETYDRSTKTLHGVTRYTLGANFDVDTIARAAGVQWNGHKWIPNGMKVFRIDQGEVVAADKTRLDLGLSPSDFALLRLDPEEFSLWELNRYIQDLRSKGLDPGGYVVDRDLKYAMPFSCLIMVALGMALSLDPLPRNLSLGRSFGLAIVIGFGYWLAMGITTSFGRSGLLTPWISAWLPNVVFAMITLSIFLFGEER